MERMSEILSKFVSFLPNFMSFIAGFAIAIFAEPARRFFFKPKLKLEFQENPYCLSSTYETHKGQKLTNAIYIRVKVTNTSKVIAKRCRAYLINIEKCDVNGNFIPTVYCDSIQLAWSCQGQRNRWRGIDICKGVNQYLDVFKETGKFLFTIQASADGADPKIIKLEFDWRGVWNDFSIKERK
jgi:hypothetical protein